MDVLEGTPRRRVLAIGAHPDDVELGAGGLVARLSRAGARVTVAVVSAPTRTDERIAEARRAAELLGASLVMLSEEPRIRVEDLPMHRLVGLLDALIEAEKPDLVLTHSAQDLHWDHRIVHAATVSALRRTPCDLLAYTSYSSEIGAATSFTNRCFADITSTIGVKMEALAAHVSQVSKQSINLDASRDLARSLGRLSGVLYAESFEVMRLRL